MARSIWSNVGHMAKQVLPYAGAIAGGLFGGPGGAAAGNIVGRGAQGLIDSTWNRNKYRQNRNMYDRHGRLSPVYNQQQQPGMNAMQNFANQQPQQPQTTQYGRSTVQDLSDRARAVQSPLYSAEVDALQKELGQMGMGTLKNLPSADFGPIEADYTRQYNEQVIPQLMEQFVGSAPGGMRTSGFKQALGAAGTGLQSKLAAMKQQFNVQRRGQEQAYGLNLLQPGMRQQFQTDFLQPQPHDLAPMAGAQMQGDQLLGSLVERALSDQDSRGEDQNEWIQKLIEMFASQQYRGASLDANRR